MDQGPPGEAAVQIQNSSENADNKNSSAEMSASGGGFIPGILPFKSRFLKTDKSTAMRQEESSAASISASTSRALRSTFSPLGRLPENGVASPPPPGDAPAGDDKLSKTIKDFIQRTDHVAQEWKNLGTNADPHKKRSSSVTRGEDSFSSPARPVGGYRASSLAPPSVSRDPFDRAIMPGSTNPFMKRVADPLVYRGDNDFTSSYSVRSVTGSVTGRAAQAQQAFLPLHGVVPAGGRLVANGGYNGVEEGGGGGFVGGLPPKVPAHQRFMSLEEECNWILSGREPVMDNGWDDDDDEDNTLDDISGDEVSKHLRSGSS